MPKPHTQIPSAVELKAPRPTTQGVPWEKPRQHVKNITELAGYPSDSELLAKPFSYHRASKIFRYDLLILRGRLWGGRFQISVKGEPRLPVGMAGNLQG